MITENLINSSNKLLNGVFNGTITIDQVKELSENSTMLDTYKKMHPSIFKAFEYDNQEKIGMLLAKINRRDTLEEKKEIIKREKDLLLDYLESESVAEEIRSYNKVENQLLEQLKHTIVKFENPPKQNEVQDETQNKEANELKRLMESTNFLENSFNLRDLINKMPQPQGESFEEIIEHLKENIDFKVFLPEGFSEDSIFAEKSILGEVREALYIHSQEQYYELIRIEEQKITGTTDTSEPTRKGGAKKAFLEIPITLERGNTDTYTKLTVNQTAILFEYLSESEVILNQIKHHEYLKTINKAKSIQALTGYKFGSITDGIEANTQKKKPSDIKEVKKIIENIKLLINRDLA